VWKFYLHQPFGNIAEKLWANRSYRILKLRFREFDIPLLYRSL
jgi:hypothetical protein